MSAMRESNFYQLPFHTLIPHAKPQPAESSWPGEPGTKY